jgi:hypothetical protein
MQTGGRVMIGRVARWILGAGLLWIVCHYFFAWEGGMSEFNFYTRSTYFCGSCGQPVLWMRRVDEGMVLLHPDTDCKLSGKTFYAPNLPLVEIKGRISDGRFVPEWVQTT